jgi:type I restriction enzyme M protein
MISNNSHHLVQKLWNYCNILRDDGLSYGDYVEQLTFLLFLKMADEQSRPPFNKPSPIPKSVDWQSLMRLDGDELETHYRHALESLGKQKGMLGSLAVNLEKPPEGGKIGVSMRWNHGEG